MAMIKRIEHLITKARRQSDNERSGTSAGISTEEFIVFSNQAQEMLQTAILMAHKKAFAEEALVNVVNGTESYSFSELAWLKSSPVNIEYSDSGLTEDYRPLEMRQNIERRSIAGKPQIYILRKDKFLVSPIPDKNVTSGFRVVYNQQLPSVDIRRTKVSAVTNAGGAMTALTLDNTYSAWSTSDWTEDDYLTVYSSTGVIKTYGVRYTSIAGTGIVTLDGNHTYRTGETVVAINDYVSRGWRATPHSQLPDICEKFLLEFMVWRALNRDSSVDALEQNNYLVEMRNTIVTNWAELEGDVFHVPVVNEEWL